MLEFHHSRVCHLGPLADRTGACARFEGGFELGDLRRRRTPCPSRMGTTNIRLCQTNPLRILMHSLEAFPSELVGFVERYPQSACLKTDTIVGLEQQLLTRRMKPASSGALGRFGESSEKFIEGTDGRAPCFI